jgi:dTDP-4-dehydrorhamnose reductase
LKVLLLGANGQLGTDLRRVFNFRGDQVNPLTRKDLDVRHRDAVFARIAEAQPDVVVNTAAFHNVELCEEQPADSFEMNATGARTLAQACDRTGCALVHFSTDFVFDGRKRKPYTEEDLPCPLSVYAASKLSGEHLIASVFERYFIVRTCGLYGVTGSKGRGGNFVEKMLTKATAGQAIRVVDDQVLTPTYTADLAEAVASLVKTGQYGLYHITNEGECSWYTFAREIFELEGTKADLAPISSREFSSPVRRPPYSVLSKNKLKALGICMPVWQDGLARYLRARQTNVQRSSTFP